MRKTDTEPSLRSSARASGSRAAGIRDGCAVGAIPERGRHEVGVEHGAELGRNGKDRTFAIVEANILSSGGSVAVQ